MRNHEVIEENLEALVGYRFTKKELKEVLEDVLGMKLDKLDNHYISGKQESPMEVYDDRFSFNLEIETGDLYFDVYYIKTNERGVLYITEVGYDYDDWKTEIGEEGDEVDVEYDYEMSLVASMEEAEETNE